MITTQTLDLLCAVGSQQYGEIELVWKGDNIEIDMPFGTIPASDIDSMESVLGRTTADKIEMRYGRAFEDLYELSAAEKYNIESLYDFLVQECDLLNTRVHKTDKLLAKYNAMTGNLVLVHSKVEERMSAVAWHVGDDTCRLFNVNRPDTIVMQMHNDFGPTETAMNRFNFVRALHLLNTGENKIPGDFIKITSDGTAITVIWDGELRKYEREDYNRFIVDYKDIWDQMIGWLNGEYGELKPLKEIHKVLLEQMSVTYVNWYKARTKYRWDRSCKLLYCDTWSCYIDLDGCYSSTTDIGTVMDALESFGITTDFTVSELLDYTSSVPANDQKKEIANLLRAAYPDIDSKLDVDNILNSGSMYRMERIVAETYDTLAPLFDVLEGCA